MLSVTLTPNQVVDLIKQLPPQQKRIVLLALAEDTQTRHDERMTFAENRLRQRAAEHSLRWDDMNENDCEAFVDDLLHEAS